MKTALSVAETISGNAPLALRAVKEALLKSYDLPLDQGLRLEGLLRAHRWRYRRRAGRSEGFHGEAKATIYGKVDGNGARCKAHGSRTRQRAIK